MNALGKSRSRVGARLIAASSQNRPFLYNRVLAKAERWRRTRDLIAIARTFEGLVTLEIGGPSAIFAKRGLLALYPQLAHCDLVNYATETLWDDPVNESIPIRRCFVAEAVDLTVPTASYDGLLASHVLEHVANPLAALREWQRVVRPGGPLLIVVPHRDFTFDHRRQVTPLEHLVEDDRARVGEQDLTHLDEVLTCHDLHHDVFAGDRQAFAERCRDNERHRGMHQHVFVTRSAANLVQHSGLTIEAITARRPHHIIVLARAPKTNDEAPSRTADLIAGALASSPFPSDAP